MKTIISDILYLRNQITLTKYKYYFIQVNKENFECAFYDTQMNNIKINLSDNEYIDITVADESIYEYIRSKINQLLNGINTVFKFV